MRSATTVTLAVLVYFAFAASASAQTYYVDSINGNDAWSGTLPTAQSTDGPWKTLAKVGATSLQPGDSVLFKCGDTWQETLAIPTSGAAGDPITFGEYGSNCNATNKPIIDGGTPISGWSVSSGGIYTAPMVANPAPTTTPVLSETFNASSTISV